MQEEFWNIESLCHNDDPRDLVKLLKYFFWLDIYEEKCWPSKNIFNRYRILKALIISNLNIKFNNNGLSVFSEYKNKYHYLSDKELSIIIKIAEIVKKYKESIYDIAIDSMSLSTLIMKKISLYFNN